MSKIQCRILKKTAEGEQPYFVLETRAKSLWWALWSDWTTESSYVSESDALEAMQFIAESWAKMHKKPKSEQIHFVQVNRV